MYCILYAFPDLHLDSILLFKTSSNGKEIGRGNPLENKCASVSLDGFSMCEMVKKHLRFFPKARGSFSTLPPPVPPH